MTFAPLQRLKADDFDLLHEDGGWHLCKDNVSIFRIRDDLVQSTSDLSEEEVALMIFDQILGARNDGVHFGYDYGRERMAQDVRILLGIEEGTFAI